DRDDRADPDIDAAEIGIVDRRRGVGIAHRSGSGLAGPATLPRKAKGRAVRNGATLRSYKADGGRDYLPPLALVSAALTSSRLSATRLLRTSTAWLLDFCTRPVSSRTWPRAFSNASLASWVCLASLSSGLPAAVSSRVILVSSSTFSRTISA